MQEDTTTPVVATEAAAPEVKTPRTFTSKRGASARPDPKRDGKGGAPRGGARRPGGRPERVKPEFEQKTIDVRRVTRVVSGGRRFTFSVALVIGDRKGRVGMGMGKAGDTAMAIDKAYKQAQKKMVVLKLNKDNSIPHELSAKFNASRINLMPNKGRGLIAGSSARVVLAMAGIQNITAKIHSGSKNKINNARVAIAALESISTPYEKKARKEGDEITSGAPRTPRTGARRTVDGRDAGPTARPVRKNFFVKRKVETENPSVETQ